MRHLLIAAAALSVGGLMASSAFAQTYAPGYGAYASSGMPFLPGGPKQLGNMCRTTTDDFGVDSYGYWAPCPQEAQARAQPVRAPAKRIRAKY